MRVSAQRRSQRSRYAWASSSRSKRRPRSGVFFAWPTLASTLPLRSGVADAARQGDDPVVGQHVAVERIQRRVVDVRGQDTFLEVVEDDDADGATQPPERPLVQLGPDLCTRSADQQPDGLARVAQGQNEEPRPTVLARRRIADHRSVAVVDLCLFSRGCRDDGSRLDGGLLPERRDEAPYACITSREAMVIDQVLPDGHGVAPAANGLDDQFAIGLAGARPWRSAGAVLRRGGGLTRARGGRGCCRRVGGHLRGNGRFCRTNGTPATAPHHQACGLQVAAGRLAPDPGGPLNPPQRPSEASQRQNLLSFIFSQDVAHAGQERPIPDRCQRLGPLSVMAGFQVSTNGRI